VLRNIDLFLHEFVRAFTKDNIDELVNFVRKFSVQEENEAPKQNVKKTMQKRMSRVSKMSNEEEDLTSFNLKKYLHEKENWKNKLKRKWLERGEDQWCDEFE